MLIIEPKKLPKVEKIENTLESKQKIVDGYIEYVSVPKYDDILIICNEEGKLRHMEFNRDIGYDIIAGPMIIVGEGKSGNDISFIEETYEGTTVYTLIVPDETYEYFCNEFSIEENDENNEHWPICPKELYDILIHNIPDFIRGSKIYIASVSTWLDKRDNFLSENDFDYIKFRDTFREIKNKLSDNGDI